MKWNWIAVVMAAIILGATPAFAFDPDSRGISPTTGGYDKGLHDSTRGIGSRDPIRDSKSAIGGRPAASPPAIPKAAARVDAIVRAQPNATDVRTGRPINTNQRPANTVAPRGPALPPSVRQAERAQASRPNATSVATGRPINADRLPTPRGTVQAAPSRLLSAARRADQAMSRTVMNAQRAYDDLFWSVGVRPLSPRELATIVAAGRNAYRGDLQAIGKDQFAAPVDDAIAKAFRALSDKLRQMKDGALYGPPTK